MSLKLFSDVVMVPFAAVAGDHLADETCQEELETKNDSKKCKVEQRLFCNRSVYQTVALLNEFFSYYPDCKYASGQEHQYACESEEMHRLLAECAQEPE